MVSVFLETKFNFDLNATVRSHGWVNLPPFSWDAKNRQLSRAERVGRNVFTVTVESAGPRALSIHMPASATTQEVDILTLRANRWLMLDWDPSQAIAAAGALNPTIAKHISLGGGRFLVGSTFFEDLYKTICTINTSWVNTVRMVRGMSQLSIGGVAATPADVLRRAHQELQSVCRMGYRAKVLCDITRELLDSGIIDEFGNLLGGQISREDLISLKGIGPYAADHLRVLQQDYSRIPVDSDVRAYCADHYSIQEVEPNDLFAQWEEYRFLGYKIDRVLRGMNWIGD